jgi:putative endonuclease
MNQRNRSMGTSTARGALGETIAACYLQLSGYEILGRNERHGRLEIDLIARRGQTVVFVEVRLRSSNKFGRPEESIRFGKRQRLSHGAAEIARRFEFPEEIRYRFDVIAIEAPGGGLTVRHLPGCFAATVD